MQFTIISSHYNNHFSVDLMAVSVIKFITCEAKLIKQL